MSRVVNFSSGPSTLPLEVLEQARAEMLDWRGTGMSVLEMSHRGKEYLSIAAETERRLRDVLGVPANYKVLFLQGGASLQFAMLPMNLMAGRAADYVHTGFWARKALEEARLVGRVNVAASGESDGFRRIPKQSEWRLTPEAAYVHITTNETINGSQFHWLPSALGETPLVADASSDILSRPLDVGRFGVVYFGAQKNAGSAGLTVVIIREDLVGQAPVRTPHLLDYGTHVETGSGYNTSPTFAVYICGLVLGWIERQGGLQVIAEKNAAKAQILYGVLDDSRLYEAPVAREDRSLMNVVFRLPSVELEDAFVAGAEEQGMVALRGHKAVGGIRASIYNAMPVEGVERLADYMREFERQRG